MKLLASDWPNHGCCGHLESEPADESSLSLLSNKYIWNQNAFLAPSLTDPRRRSQVLLLKAGFGRGASAGITHQATGLCSPPQAWPWTPRPRTPVSPALDARSRLGSVSEPGSLGWVFVGTQSKSSEPGVCKDHSEEETCIAVHSLGAGFKLSPVKVYSQPKMTTCHIPHSCHLLQKVLWDFP